MIDEDCTGSVSKQDYYSTLGAYGVASESGLFGRGGRTFEQDCRLKLARALGKSPEDAWTDLAGTQSAVSIVQFRTWLDTLSENIRDREKVALLMYYAPEDNVRKPQFIQDMRLLQGLLMERDAGSLPPVDKKLLLRPPAKQDPPKKLPSLHHPLTVQARELQQKALTDKRPEYTKEQNLQQLHDKIAARVSFSDFLLGGLEWGAPRPSAFSKSKTKQKLDSLSTKGLSDYLNEMYGTILGTLDRSLLVGFWDAAKKGSVSIEAYKTLFKGCTKEIFPFAELALAVLARDLDCQGISTSAYLQNLGGASLDLCIGLSLSTATFTLKQSLYFTDDELDVLVHRLKEPTAANVLMPRRLIEAVNKFRGPAENRPSEFFEPRFKLATRITWSPSQDSPLTRVIAKIVVSKKPTMRTWLRQVLAKGDVIEIDVVKESVKSIFNPILSAAEILVLQDALDIKNLPKVTIEGIISSLHPGYSGDIAELTKLHLGLTAILLDREKQATVDQLLKQNLSPSDRISLDEFTSNIGRWLRIPEDRQLLRGVFKFLGDQQMTFLTSDLISYIDFFRKTNPASQSEDKVLKGAKEQNKSTVVGDTNKGNDKGKMQRDQVIHRVKNALSKQKLSALHVYRLADPEEIDETSVISLKRELQRVLPELDPTTLLAVVKLADSRRTGFVKREDWELLVMTNPEDLVEMEHEDSRRDLSQSLIADNLSVVSNTSKKSTRAVTAGDPVHTLMLITSQLQREGITPEQLFEQLADENGSESIPTQLLFQTLLRFAVKIPNTKKPEIAGVVKHIDIQQRGFVTKGELLVSLQPLAVPLVSNQNAPIEEGLPELKLGRHSVSRPPVTYEARLEIKDSEFHELVHQLKEAIAKTGIQLKTVFSSVADLEEYEPIPVLTLTSRLQTQLPNFNRQKLMKVMKYVDINKNGLISKEELEVTLGYNESKDELELSTFSKDAAAIDTSVLSKTKEALEKRGLDTNRLFDYSDIDRDGLITILDLKNGYERVFCPGPDEMPDMLDFLKEVRRGFKTSRFTKEQLNLFMEQPDQVKVYKQIVTNIFPELEPALAKVKQAFKVVTKQKSLEEIAQDFDSNSDGVLTKDEFSKLLDKVVGNGLDPQEKEGLYRMMDKQQLGKVKTQDFCTFVELEVRLEEGRRANTNQFETVDARLMKGEQANTPRNPMQQLAGYMSLVSRMKEYRAVLTEMAVDLEHVYQQEGLKADRKLRYPEFCEVFSKKINLGLDEFQMVLLFGEIDVNGDGGVSPEEFKSYLDQVAKLSDLDQAKKLSQQTKMSIFMGKVDAVSSQFFKECGKDENAINSSYNLCLQKIQIGDEQKWRGHNSIFTHPLAALKAAEDLIVQTKKRNQRFFTDQDFGPSVTDPTGDSSVVCREWERSPLPSVADYTWLRPHEISTRAPPLFMDPSNSSLGDIMQGLLGDCWFLSSLITISAKRKYLTGSVETEADMMSGIYPPIFHSLREYGMYVMRFCIDDQWVYVIIDDRIPVHRDSRSPFLTHSYREDIFWPALIEKAYAKLHGKYHRLQTGTTHEGITDCTGLFSQRFDLSDEAIPIESLWAKILQAYNRGGMLAGSIRLDNQEQPGSVLKTDEGKDTGLYKGHAYSVVGVYELPPATTGKDYPVQLVRLRNPWGNRESVLEWSDYSEEIIQYKKA